MVKKADNIEVSSLQPQTGIILMKFIIEKRAGLDMYFILK